jgi:hypothetical protein
MNKKNFEMEIPETVIKKKQMEDGDQSHLNQFNSEICENDLNSIRKDEIIQNVYIYFILDGIFKKRARKQNISQR